jgi:UDP-N-acetylglucosamine--N-acetylmuramyl-(pentapeptide) pyrophosphoryl-undecaprenol N-acetylglucosamine transferase
LCDATRGGNELRAIFAGGVTGGHIYPVLSVIKELYGQNSLDGIYFSVKGKLETKIVPENFSKIKIEEISVEGLKRPLYKLENISILARHLRVKSSIKKIIRDFKPDFAFISGGYISFPVAEAAHELNIPVFLHEQNITPGLANKKISKYARKTFISFEESKKYFAEDVRKKIVLTGNPIFVRGTAADVPHPAVLVLGGSGGSEILNKYVSLLYGKMPGVYFIHATGDKDVPETNSKNVLMKNYIENTSSYWRSVDAAIIRGGATSIAEALYYNVPSIVVPWSGAAENHQYRNALYLKERGLAEILTEKDLSEITLAEKLKGILKMKKSNSVIVNPSKLIVDIIEREVYE